MLPTDMTDALIGTLAGAEADAHLAGWGRPEFVLLFISHRPAPAGDGPHQRLRVCEYVFDGQRLATHPGGVAEVMQHLATALGADDPDRAGQAPEPDPDGPGWRTLAWAAIYEDVNVPHLTRARHVDAVDADGRVYQLRRLETDEPLLSVDNLPDPADTPATQPALAALVAVTTRPPATHP